MTEAIKAKIARLKAELEKLTGKMVSFRSREIYNAAQRRLQQARRERMSKTNGR